MAKTALVQKAARKPKFKVRGYTRCQRCGRSHSVYQKFGLCRICLREMAHAGRTARRHKAILVVAPASSNTFATGLREPSRERRRNDHRHHHADRGRLMTMTDPIADMLTRLRNGNSAYQDVVSMPHSKLKVHIAEILKQEGYIGGFDIADAPEGQVGKVLTLQLKYGPNRERSIAGIRRVSKPGLRVYAKSTGAAARARRSRRRDLVDVVRTADRPAGRQAWSRRGSPRLRLVGGNYYVSNWTGCRSRCPVASRSTSTASWSRSRAPRARCRTRSPSRSRSAATTTARCTSRVPTTSAQSRSLHGLSRTLIANMVIGVTPATPRRSRSSAPVTACRPRAPTSSSRSGSRTRCW